MAVPVISLSADSDPTIAPITEVRDPCRLRAVAEADLRGHLGDPDLDAVVETLRLASGSAIAVVNIVTADLQTYPAEVGVGAACTSVPDGLSFCAEVVDTGKALLVSDAAVHPVYSQNPLVLDGIVGAYAGVPLVDRGVVLGSVSIFDSHAREFPADVLAILQYQGRLAASVLALRRSARTDVLTGLPNRALFGSATDAEMMAARLVAAATEPWAIQGQRVSVDVSIGFAVTDSATTDAMALLRDADDAMYLAKVIRGSGSVMSVGR